MSISVVDVERAPASEASEEPNSPEMLTFPPEETGRALYLEDSVQISRGDLRANAHGGELAEVVFFSYGNLHELLGDARRMFSEPRQQEQEEEMEAGARLVINSRVASASLGRAGRHLQLESPARVRLAHLRRNLTDPVCVFWDLEASAWSDAGCRVAQTSEAETVCECDHLTNFALLMVERDGSELGGGGLFGGVFGRLDVFGSVTAAVLLFALLLIVLMVREMSEKRRK